MSHSTLKKDTNFLASIEPLVELLNKAFHHNDLPTIDQIKSLGSNFHIAIECIALGLERNSAMSQDKIANLQPELAKKIASGSELIHLSNIYIQYLLTKKDNEFHKQPSTSASKPVACAPDQKQLARGSNC